MPVATTIAVLLFGMTMPKRDFQKWPLVTLDDLVKLHDRLELPCPPADAKFFVWVDCGNEREGQNYIDRGFGFQSKPRTRSKPEAEYWGGRIVSVPIWRHVTIVRPEPQSIRLISKISSYEVLNAVYCRKLGYEKLGNEIFTRWQPISNESPAKYLVQAADSYWTGEIGNPDRDRKTIIRMLKELNRIKPEERYASIIESLELADKPLKPTNDPREKIFDDWVHTRDDAPNELLTRKPKVLALLKQGFDAMPAIISHLDDRRMTRIPLVKVASVEYLTVSQICGFLLDEIAGQRIPRISLTEKERTERTGSPPGPGFFYQFDERDKTRPLKRDAVNEWWQYIRARSEKAYWIEKSLNDVTDGDRRTVGGVNDTALLILSARFPGELKAVYHDAIDAHPPKETLLIAEAIANSTLDRAEKRRCLELGLLHRDFEHRLAAFQALSITEPDEYTKRLAAMMERIPTAEPDDPISPFQSYLTSLCSLSKDPSIWLVLERTIRRLPLNSRFDLLDQVSQYDNEKRNLRREQIRLLAAFLDDLTRRNQDELDDYVKEHGYIAHYAHVLGNFVAYQLAPYYVEHIDYDEHRSNDEWAFLRKWLKDEVAKELKEPVKK